MLITAEERNSEQEKQCMHKLKMQVVCSPISRNNSILYVIIKFTSFKETIYLKIYNIKGSSKWLFAFIQIAKPEPPNSLGFQDAANTEKNVIIYSGSNFPKKISILIKRI